MDAYQESLKTMRDNHATAEYVEKAVEKAVDEKEEQTIVNLLNLGVLTNEQIAESVKVSVEKVQTVALRHRS